MKNNTGYIKVDNETIIETKPPKSLSISEQEVHISFIRDEDFAIIYVSDSTYITKLNKLCVANPDMWSIIAETKVSKTYRVEDKTLISFRSKKREITEEQRLAAGERMKKYQADKRS